MDCSYLTVSRARYKSLICLLSFHCRAIAAGAALATAAQLSACGGGADDQVANEIASQPDVALAQALRNAGKDTTPPAVPVPSAPPASPTGSQVLNHIVVRASSVPVQGTGALIQLRYRGVVIADGEVNASSLTDWHFRVEGSFGGDILDLVFTNAGLPNTPYTRRLAIDAVFVNGTRFAPTAPGVTFDLGHGLAAFDGIDVKSGSGLLAETGALRLPMPAANQIGIATVSPEPATATPGPYADFWFGADSNPGTRSRPYRTLAALRGRTLLAGEHIHLRCGNMWRESLVLGVGELADGTEIRRFGDDCATAGNPVISGADQFNGGWARSGQIWSRALPAGTPRISRLFVGHTVMRPAQWPNASEPQALVEGAVAGQPSRFRVTPAAAAALSGRNLAGATALVRTTAWKIENFTVAAGGLQGQEVALNSAPGYAVKGGDAYAFRDQAWMLDAPGEFFHDTVAQRLFLIPTAGDAALDLNASSIEGSVRDVAIEWRGRKQIGVIDIAVRMARQDGIRITDSPQARLLRVESRENGSAGIRLMQWTVLAASSPGPSVRQSLLAGNGEYGVDATFVRKADISANRVIDTGLGTHIGNSFAGISTGPGGQVADNVIDGTAYAGIMFSSLDGSSVARNEITRYCVRLSDCGGVYTWTGESGVSTQQSSLIEANRIHGATAASTGSGGEGRGIVVGIYLDEFTQGANVRGNFLQGMPMGILLHNASRNTVESNRIWLAQRVGLWVNMTRTDADWSTANRLQNNEILPMVVASGTWPALPSLSISHPIWFMHDLSGQAALAVGRNEFANNRVIQINGTLREHALIAGPSPQGERHVHAAAWREVNPQEPLPERPITFTSYFLDLGPEKLTGGQFQSGLQPWLRHYNWQLSNSVNQVSHVQAQAGCNGPCIRMTVAERSESIYSPSFNLTPGVPHLYQWTALATQSNATVGESYISTAQSPWSKVEDTRGFVTLHSRDLQVGEARRYEAFFVPTTAANARVNMQLDALGVAVHLDDISVREIRGWWLGGPPEWVATVVAPRDTARTVSSCTQFGWPAGCALLDAAGATVSLPLTVPAGGAQLLFWADSPYRR